MSPNVFKNVLDLLWKWKENTHFLKIKYALESLSEIQKVHALFNPYPKTNKIESYVIPPWFPIKMVNLLVHSPSDNHSETQNI